jgi:hypothetical protein
LDCVGLDIGDVDSDDQTDTGGDSADGAGEDASRDDIDDAGPGFAVAVGILAVIVGFGIHARGHTGGIQ